MAIDLAEPRSLVLDKDIIRPRPGPGKLALVEKYFGKSLAEGLPERAIRRVVDVGVGGVFTTLNHLAGLRDVNGNPLYSSEDLLAVDPKLILREQVGGPSITLGEKFKMKGETVQELRDQVQRGDIKPFDLVISSGLISGGNFDADESESNDYTEADAIEAMNKAKEITEAMRGIMNQQNPNALMVVSERRDEEVLLLTRQELANLGLKIVDYTPAGSTREGKITQAYIDIFRKYGLFPQDPQDCGYNTVVCKLEQ